MITAGILALSVTGVACSSSEASATVPASVTQTTEATSTALPAPFAGVTPPAPDRGGNLRIGQAIDPASCDLHSASALGYQSVHPCNPLLSQLVMSAAGDHASLEPDLATDWSVSPDGTVWRFDLRGGVKWHDGSEFTVEDAVFSLQRAIDPPPGIAPGRASAIGRYVSAPGQIRAEDKSLVVETDFAAASFLVNLASVYVAIYPRQATIALDPPSMTAFESVIGTGPFKSGDVVRGSRYRLVRNEDYYLPGLPYLDVVEFHVIPEQAVRIAALRSHEIDTIAIITEAEAVAIEEDFAGRITVFRTPSAGGNTVQMNLNVPPFNDPRVRRAVNLAISRSEAEMALGEGIAGAILPPGGQFSLPPEMLETMPGYADAEANRLRARELLADAGFPDGFATTIHTRANFFFNLLSEFAAGQLAEVGIKARVVQVEPVTYQQMITGGDFAMIGHSHSFALDDPDSILPAHYGCGGEENFPGLCDHDLDAMIEQQSRELDVRRRRELLAEIERRIWEVDAKIWFQWSLRRTPAWNDIAGLEPGGPSLYQGRRLDRVYIQRGG